MAAEQTTAVLKERVDGHDRRLDGHEERFAEHQDWLVKITNRPPVWAMALVTLLTGLVCALSAAIATYMLSGQ